jgi:hypothetical protein
VAFDLDLTLKDMAAAAAGVFEKESKKVGKAARVVLQDRREAVEAIAAARLALEIDDEELKIQLADEKLAFQTGMLMVKALTKASIQKAANAAFAVLTKAIKAAL